MKKAKSGFEKMKNPIKKQRVRLLFLSCFLLLILYTLFSFYQSNFRFTVTRYIVESPNLPNSFTGYRIAQISDLHGKDFADDLLEALDREQPDIVVITGDLVSFEDEDFSDEVALIQAISNSYTSYYIMGNHEYWLEDHLRGELLDQLAGTGVTILDNRSIPIIRQEGKIVISGLQEDEFYYSCKAEETPMPVEHFLGPKRNDFTVLLAHNPLYWKDYLSWGADLTLSGHLHGGGIRLPLVGGVFSPEMSFFPKYSRGLFRQGDKSMVVSAGLGNSGIPFRLFNRPELVIIDLQSLSIY